MTDEPEYATGAPVSNETETPLLVGHACGCRDGCAPANITVNIHGTVVGENDIARIVRDEVRRWNQRGGNGSAPA